ncbi:MAG: aminopeptidase [Actinomycetota bacterium]|nr:aminopeptidase [Actinomycetota bacterium]
MVARPQLDQRAPVSDGPGPARPSSTLPGIVDQVSQLARLAVGVGANVAAGQTVVVNAKLGQEPLARAVAAAAYEVGAHQVEVNYGDPHVQRVRLQHAPEEALGEVIPWVRERPLKLAEVGAALISLSGPVAPGLLDDLDPGRIGRDTVALKEAMMVLAQRALNWTIVPGPNAAWARLVHPGLEPDRAQDKLWEEIVHICRLDEKDPVSAWWERSAQLSDAARRLQDAQLDSLHFSGPGTDLTVGLLPGVRWNGGSFQTAWGREHIPNLPTEEVFTSPDPERTEGYVASTKPLLVSGRAVQGLRVRFAGGRAVEIDADQGAPLLRELVRRDEGAGRLGEVALVDSSGRIGTTGTVFHDTLLDENAASHIALGSGFAHLAPDDSDVAQRINESAVHTDFMIGGPDVRVTGRTRDGRELPVLDRGRWGL